MSFFGGPAAWLIPRRSALCGKTPLSTGSFISASSLQEITRVLAEAAIDGKID